MCFRDVLKIIFYFFWIELLLFSEFGRAFEGGDDIRIFEKTTVFLFSFFLFFFCDCHRGFLY